jgi:hypothetical protein
MSDAPVRSLQTSGPLARLLLESGRADQPQPGARDRALLAFGFAPLSVLAVAPPVTATVASAPAPAGALAGSSKAAAWMLVGKSVAIGALGSVLAIGLVKSVVTNLTPTATLQPQHAAPTDAPPSLAAPSSTLRSTPSPRAASSTTKSTLTLAQKPTQKPADALAAPAGGPASTPSAAVNTSSTLELEALARVRRALSAHESARALAMLDDFTRRFPASRVAEEAAVLRIESLRALGRSSEALALARQFLHERPSSIYGAKVSAMASLP